MIDTIADITIVNGSLFAKIAAVARRRGTSSMHIKYPALATKSVNDRLL